MFKDTCLVAHKRIDQSPHIFGLEIQQTVVAPKQDYLTQSTHSLN
jgi:hypothetical protein